MLIEMLRSLEGDFILAERQVLFADTAGYVDQSLKTIKGEGPSRMTGKAYLVLEKNYGPGAGLGFLITLQLLRRWTERQNDRTWLASQYEAVDTMGSKGAGEYVIAFLNDPPIEIRRLCRLLTANSLLRGFIADGDARWPSFPIGAYLLIGLLLHAERFNDQETTMLVE